MKSLGCSEPLRIDDDAAGAVVMFAGTVRAQEGERRIPHLAYDHYEGMAQRETRKLMEEARRRWPLRRIVAFHRTGEVPVGESAVIVAVSAGHRSEAFEAARFLIDELKRSVPIWKRAPA
ncbi:molybdenum cofactor biosynthesis protein MoaE [Candidatus Sumerlaeota bacterium]|nr:molybdenum cofactor biosynthesis protein MoaE [Candidatus Sumerlaeota bacterium]